MAITISIIDPNPGRITMEQLTISERRLLLRLVQDRAIAEQNDNLLQVRQLSIGIGRLYQKARARVELWEQQPRPFADMIDIRRISDIIQHGRLRQESTSDE